VSLAFESLHRFASVAVRLGRGAEDNDGFHRSTGVQSHEFSKARLLADSRFEGQSKL
jgi:hypothetical protein